MKIKLRTWQIATLFLLAVAIPASLTITLAQTQKSEPLTESCRGHHANNKDFFANMRVKPPLTVMSIDGDRLNYAVTDNQGIDLGSLDLEAGWSIVPAGFAAQHDGCYGVTYCDLHKVVLTIQQLDPKNCGVVKQ